MKRRDFVKGLAATPLVTMAPKAGAIGNRMAVTGSSLADGATKRLNVVVHGMFVIAIDTKANKVYLKAPKVDTHAYRAQAFITDPNDKNGVLPAWPTQAHPQDYDEVKSTNTAVTNDTLDFDRGGASTLVPLDLGDAERIAVNSNLSTKVSPIWNVTLWMPDDIWPLRETRFNYFDSSGNSTDSYHANEMYGTQRCAISHVLTYNQIPAKAEVTFLTMSGKSLQVPWGSDGVGRVHFYAEPPTPPAQVDAMGRTDKATTAQVKKHLDMALQALDNLFDPALNLKFISGIEPDQALGYIAANDPWFASHPSVRPCEQLSLAERLQAQGQSGGCLDGMKTTIREQYAEFQSFQDRVILQSLSRKENTQIMVPPTKPPRNCIPLFKIP